MKPAGRPASFFPVFCNPQSFPNVFTEATWPAGRPGDRLDGPAPGPQGTQPNSQGTWKALEGGEHYDARRRRLLRQWLREAARPRMHRTECSAYSAGRPRGQGKPFRGLAPGRPAPKPGKAFLRSGPGPVGPEARESVVEVWHWAGRTDQKSSPEANSKS
jgi:hypothetical protein